MIYHLYRYRSDIIGPASEGTDTAETTLSVIVLLSTGAA